jgi:hypothetical protein
MPKVLTSYEVQSIAGGRSDEGNPVRTAVPVSKIDMIFADLMSYIQAGSVDKFNTLMSSRFTYPECIESVDAEYGTESEWWKNRYDCHYSRPMIEALFFDHSSKLLKIVDELMKQDNDALFQVFIAALNKTDVSGAMLFAWTDEMKTQVKLKLAAMHAYSVTLRGTEEDESAIIKGMNLQELHHSLQGQFAQFKLENEMLNKGLIESSMLTTKSKAANQISDLDVKHTPSANKDVSSQFHKLRFKLKFAETLHNEDEWLSVHRGLKKIVTNFMTILFSGGVLNVLNRIVTGNWLFFNKTTSEEKASDVQTAIGFKSGMHFDNTKQALKNEGGLDCGALSPRRCLTRPGGIGGGNGGGGGE